MELVERLIQIAKARGLDAEAIESCRRALEEAHRESEEVGEAFCGGIDIAELILTWRRHALVFGHRLLTCPFIESTVEISVPDPDGVYVEGTRPIGTYRLITDLESGKAEEDYLEWFHLSDVARNDG